MIQNNGHNEIWKSVTAPKPQPGPETPVTPLKPIPAPGTWQTKEHYLGTIGGLLESAENHLKPEVFAALLETMQDGLAVKIAQVAQCLPPQSAYDLADAALKVLTGERGPDVVVTWGGLGPVVTKRKTAEPWHSGGPAKEEEPEGTLYSAGEGW